MNIFTSPGRGLRRCDVHVQPSRHGQPPLRLSLLGTGADTCRVRSRTQFVAPPTPPWSRQRGSDGSTLKRAALNALPRSAFRPGHSTHSLHIGLAMSTCDAPGVSDDTVLRLGRVGPVLMGLWTFNPQSTAGRRTAGPTGDGGPRSPSPLPVDTPPPPPSLGRRTRKQHLALRHNLRRRGLSVNGEHVRRSSRVQHPTVYSLSLPCFILVGVSVCVSLAHRAGVSKPRLSRPVFSPRQ